MKRFILALVLNAVIFHSAYASTLYSADNANIFTVDLVTGVGTTLGGSGANALVFGPDGTLYSANNANIFTIDLVTGLNTTLSGSGATVLIFGPDGTLYSANNANIFTVDLVTGLYTTLSGSGANALVFGPVPIPAAVWLFGSALGLLGWMRRTANT